MGFGDMLNRYFSKEEIKTWTSIRKSGYILLPLFIYFLVHDVAEILLWAGVNQLMVKGSTETNAFLTNNAYTVQGIVNGLMLLIGVAAIWKAVKSEVLANGASKEMRISDKLVTDYAVIAALAFVAAFGLNILFHLLGITESSEAFNRAANAQYGVDFLIGLLLYGIVSPIAEEAVFRGVMYNRMKRCFGMLPALFLSALLFGCYHGNPVQAIYGTLLGILIAYVYEKYGSFAAPVLFHAVANVSIYALTYHNSLSRLTEIAGGIAVIVSTAACIGCLLYVRKRNCNKIRE